MKTISIFQVQDINNLLKEHEFDYILKLRDACNDQSLSILNVLVKKPILIYYAM